jgi:hypothetical protein
MAVSMKSKSGGGSIKGRRRKTPEPKRRNTPKAVSFSNSSGDDKPEVARLTRELNEALERQSAASEVLNVISGSAGELDPVFNAILRNAAGICQAKFGTLILGSIRGHAFRIIL